MQHTTFLYNTVLFAANRKPTFALYIDQLCVQHFGFLRKDDNQYLSNCTTVFWTDGKKQTTNKKVLKELPNIPKFVSVLTLFSWMVKTVEVSYIDHLFIRVLLVFIKWNGYLYFTFFSSQCVLVVCAHVLADWSSTQVKVLVGTHPSKLKMKEMKKRRKKKKEEDTNRPPEN